MEDEIRKLRKEIEFLNKRRIEFRNKLHTATSGSVTVIINGLESPHYAHYMYLDKRLKNAVSKLEKLLMRES